MEEHIINLLNQNLRVIIPDFGAFIIRQKEPRVVVFNEFLRYNDGILVDFVARHENIDRETARQDIMDFVNDVSATLENTGSFIMEGLGMLNREDSGKMSFVAMETAEPAGIRETPEKEASAGSVAGKVRKPAVKKASAGKRKQAGKSLPRRPGSKKSIHGVTEVSPPFIMEGEILKDEKAASITEGVSRANESTPSAGEMQPVEWDLLPAANETAVTDSRPATANNTGDLLVPGAERPVMQQVFGAKARRGNINNQLLASIAVILIANICILGWSLYKDDIRGFFDRGNHTALAADSLGAGEGGDAGALSEGTSISIEETDLMDSGGPEAPAVTLPQSPVTSEDPDLPVSPASLRYYIVAGCFRDEINADELVDQLKDKGYHAEKFGKIGNLYAVSYASFSSKEEAAVKLEEMRANGSPDAWMTSY